MLITLITGDLNADIYNRNDAKEKQIKALIVDHGLLDITSHLGTIPTYKHVYLGHQSHVDMLLLKQVGTKVQVEPNSVNIMSFEEDKCISNTSSHVPVAATFILNTKTQSAKVTKKSSTRRYLWDKANPDLFKDVVNTELGSMDLSLLSHENAMPVIQAVINEATVAAVPYSTRHHGRNGKQKWYPE